MDLPCIVIYDAPLPLTPPVYRRLCDHYPQYYSLETVEEMPATPISGTIYVVDGEAPNPPRFPSALSWRDLPESVRLGKPLAPGMRRRSDFTGREFDEPVPGAPTPGASQRQVGGTHYKDTAVQPWDVIDTWPREQRIGAYRAGALKYLMRMGSKDENAQEIAKGQHYMEKLLEVLRGDAP